MSTAQECGTAAEIYSSLRNVSCRSVHPPRRRWTEASPWIPAQDPLLKQNQIFFAWRWGERICLSCILRWAVSKRHSAHLSMQHFPAERVVYFTSTPSFFWGDVEVFASRVLHLGKCRSPASLVTPAISCSRYHFLENLDCPSASSVGPLGQRKHAPFLELFPSCPVTLNLAAFRLMMCPETVANVQSSQCFSTLSEGADKTAHLHFQPADFPPLHKCWKFLFFPLSFLHG